MQVTRGIGRKKETQVLKNCQFTDEELSTHYTDLRVKLSFYGLGLSTHFRARVKYCLGLNTYLQWLAFS